MNHRYFTNPAVPASDTCISDTSIHSLRRSSSVRVHRFRVLSSGSPPLPAAAMPPVAPPADQKAGPGPRQPRHAGTLAAPRESLAQRSASFHGRGAAEQQLQQRDGLLLRQRPRTHPDLLAGVRDRSFRRTGTDRGGDAAAARAPWAGAGGRAAPSKVLVTVAVQRSMWPLHVMARAEWRVTDLVAAAVGLYVGERRRPLLPSADPAAFGLHYSQFSLQSTWRRLPRNPR